MRKREQGIGVLALLLGVFAMTGCARSTVTTTVAPDGSWVRKVAFYTPAPSEQGLTPSAKMEDTFVLPAGAPWKLTKSQKESMMTLTAERALQAGAILKQDIAIKGGAAAKVPVLINEVSVRQVAPGRWQYREVLHWQGPPPKDYKIIDPEMLAAVKNALPPKLATDANVKETANLLQREFLRMLVGPGEPMLAQLLGQIMINPDLAEKIVMRRIGGIINKGLEAKFGADMTPEERIATTRKLVTSAFNSTQSKTKAKANPGALGAPKEKDESPFVSLLFSVKLPGKIVETNGEMDDLTGEVYWSLLPEAAGLGDVVLTATCEM